jgi:hypothetical protein
MLRWNALYVSVNKTACTSLKWLVADLQGEPLGTYRDRADLIARAI